jgi:hypothetical protein
MTIRAAVVTLAVLVIAAGVLATVAQALAT